MEPILSLTSAILTLITTVFGVFQDKKSLVKKLECNNIQLQKISGINTSGNNSAINIMAMQIQDSRLIRKYQEEQIEKQRFLENLKRLSAYNKFFLILCPIIIGILFLGGKLSSVIIALQICNIVVNSFSISLYFRYVFHRYVSKIKNRGRETDLASRIIRAIEFLVYPLFLFCISLLSLSFSVIKYHHEINENILHIFLIVVYIISCYVESMLFSFVIIGNIWSIKMFLKKFFFALFLLLVTVVAAGTMVYRLFL